MYRCTYMCMYLSILYTLCHKSQQMNSTCTFAAPSLQHTAKSCRTIQHTATHESNTLMHNTMIATHCHALLQHTATHKSKIYMDSTLPATDCNILQHTAATGLQHTNQTPTCAAMTATHCNIVPHTAAAHSNPKQPYTHMRSAMTASANTAIVVCAPSISEHVNESCHTYERVMSHI